MNQKDKFRELTILNIIMLLAICLGLILGLLIKNLLGGLAAGMLVGFIGRLVYLRKKYKEINPK